jgi:pyridoxal phosphate enzyme (YggS family)
LLKALHGGYEFMFDPKENLAEVTDLIGQAAAKASRKGEDVSLVAVSKVHGPDRIRPVLLAGHRVFGENRVQEALTKWPALREEFEDIELHLIGPLQTNKVRDAVALFDVIESVDRPKLAAKLAQELARQDKPDLPVLVQVNTGKEEQKGGITPEDADRFIAACREEHKLNVVGVMCLPPADEEPSLHFMLLEDIAKRNGLSQISMGMSGDFEVAIAFGATHVRVGTAIFGERPKKAPAGS